MRNIIIFLLIGIHPSLAQTFHQDRELNLSFERVLENGYTPANWKSFKKGHSIEIDFSERYDGKGSLLIESDKDRLKKDSIALVAQRIEPVRGRIVQLSGYLKLNNIDGRAGLSLVTNGPNGQINSEEMKIPRLDGTRSWTKYSISLPIPDSTSSIDIAVYLIGDGQLWVDALELSIDGHNISDMAMSVSQTDSLAKFAGQEQFPSRFGTSVISNKLLNDSLSLVSGPPTQFSFHPFYQKYLNESGLSIIGSQNVSDEAFYRARRVLRMMLGKVPQIKSKLIENNARIAIIGKDEQMTDLPEYSELDISINARARGLGGTIEFPLTSFGEENILGLKSDRYKGENILVHEFAHTIHMIGISLIDPDFDEELRTAYAQASEEGLWDNTYASTSAEEYFAEGVQSWFNVNVSVNEPNGIHNSIDTNLELKTYDPRLYNLISKYFFTE